MSPTPAMPPGGPELPEHPDPVVPAEIAAALREVMRDLQAAITSGYAELAGAMRPGANVRDLPSDSGVAYRVPVTPGVTDQLVAALETRTRVTLIAPSGDGAPNVWLSFQPGMPAGGANTALLPPGTPIDIDTRAALYATLDSDETDPAYVEVISQQALYTP